MCTPLELEASPLERVSFGLSIHQCSAVRRNIFFKTLSIYCMYVHTNDYITLTEWKLWLFQELPQDIHSYSAYGIVAKLSMHKIENTQICL